MNHAERLLRLAEREISCEPAGTGLDGLCTSCHGTGKVRKFPMLRGYTVHGVWCPDSHGHCTRPGDGQSCQGRGWVPVDSTDATVEAILHTGWYVAEISRWDSPATYTVVLRGAGPKDEVKTVAPELNEALVAALYKVEYRDD